MANDFATNAASGGATFASDEAAGARHYQLIKLADGTADATTVIAADEGGVANALRVVMANDVGNGTIFAADGQAYGVGVLMQGDDGTNRTALLVDTDGHPQVDVLSGGGGTQYAVDTAAGAVDTGMLALAIRDDALTTLTPVDGDYVGLRVSSTGALHVTGGGGGTEYTEDVATANPIVGSATVMERDDVIAALTPVAGDWAAMRCSAEGALWVQDFNSDAALALLGTMDADTGAIKTAIELLDNAVDGNYLNVNLNSAGTDLAMNAGAMSAQTTRVVIANDDTHFGTVGAASDIDGVVHGQLRYIADYLVTMDADTGAIKTAIELLDNAVDGNYLNVNLNAAGTDLTMNTGVLTAQTQRVTIATDGPVVGYLTSMDVDTGNIATSTNATKTAVEILDNTVAVLGTATYAETTTSGNVIGVVRNDALATLVDTDNEIAPLQVNASGALYAVLSAGTAAFGKLAANTGVDIGDVDVTSIVPLTGATNLGKAEDAAHSSGDVGVEVLTVRNDVLATLSGTDGDYSPQQVDGAGALYVNPAGGALNSASGVAAGGAPGTDNMIAAQGGGLKTRVVAMSLTATSTTVNNVFVDNVDNDLWHNTANPLPLSLDADGDTVPGIVLGFNPAGWFTTDADEAVTLNSSAAQDIAWSISWVYVA